MSSSTSGPGSSEPAADPERLPPGRRELVFGRGLLRLWTVVLAGPFVWAADLLLAYLLVYRFCHTRNSVPLHMETAAALAVVAIAGVAAVRMLGWYPDASRYGGQPDDRARVMVVAAIGLNALFFLILAAAVPRFTLDPCL